MIKKTILLMTAMLILCICPSLLFAVKTPVDIPMTLDYPFIRMVLIDQLYSQPNERAVVIDEKTGGSCANIEMWNPEVRPDGAYITIGSNIKVMGGVPILGKCVQMINWEGYIEVSQRVVLDEATSRLKLETVDSHVYKTNRQPITIATKVWDLIKTHVHPYFSKVIIDLSFPVDEIRTMLPLFFSADERSQVEEWMKSMKLGGLRVEKDALWLNLAMEVETTPPAPSEPSLELSADEIDRISKLWETWDAFVVFQLETLLESKLTDKERQSLFETLLETRYGFVRALSEKTAGQDLVRKQFVWTWHQLSEVLRSHLVKKAGHDDLLKFLAFFTASDALTALDKLGPTLNLEISRNGLIRMAQLLGAQEVALKYSPAVDSNLRALMGFGPPMDESGPSYKEIELLLPEEEPADSPSDEVSRFLLRFLISPAYAAEAAPPDVEALKQWLAPKDDLGPYLERVRQVLEKTADESLAKSRLDSSYQSLYRLMIMATAWQESCWRQLIKTDGRVKPLFSYNQSSVGLMQINERVWRGIYKTDSLRWNIEYNARAGAEILDHYFKDFAIKKMDPKNPLDQDTLGRAVYAMYNGGPGQFQEFLKRKKTNSFYESDNLYWDKYTMAKAGEFDKVSVCLTGK
jgi:hypothetical protein